MTYFQTKLRPEDFIVTEILAEEPDGYWDFHYILLEKKWLTTFLLLDLLIKDFALNKNMVGIAGLKDKHAITRQRISISKRDVAKNCGGINTLLAWMRKKGRVVTATYGDHMLKLGENAGNQFTIKLVPQKPITDKVKQAIEQILTELAKRGVPNYFGEQRFGHGGTNRKIGHELLAGTIRNIKWDKNTLAEKRFKVQAFASYVFNVYLEEREKKWLLYKTIPWDIFVKNTTIVTWPVPWDDLALAAQDAATLEQAVFAKAGLSQQLLHRFKPFGLYGIRRPILLFPQNLTYKRWAQAVLTLSFSLPSGAYATVLIDQLEKQLAHIFGTTKNTVSKDASYKERWEKNADKNIYWKLWSKSHNKNNEELYATKKGTKNHKDNPKFSQNIWKKDAKPAKIIDPTINPYTGQKYNLQKLAERKKQEKRPQKWFVGSSVNPKKSPKKDAKPSSWSTNQSKTSAVKPARANSQSSHRSNNTRSR